MKLMSPKAFYYTVGKKNFFPVHPVWDLCPVLLSAVNEPVHAGLCG